MKTGKSHPDIQPQSPSPSASSSPALPLLFYYSYYVIYGFLTSPHCLEFATPCCQISVWSIQAQCSCCQLSPFVPSPPHYLGAVFVPGFNFRYVTFIITTISHSNLERVSVLAGLVVRLFPVCNVACHLDYLFCILHRAFFIFFRPCCLFHGCGILCASSCPSTIPCIKMSIPFGQFCVYLFVCFSALLRPILNILF